MRQAIIALLLLFACASVGQAQEPEKQNSASVVKWDGLASSALTLSHPIGTLDAQAETIKSATLEDGKLVLVVVIHPSYQYTLAIACSGPCDFRRLEKRIYAARDGQIVLERVIPGRIVPAQAERFEFEEETPKVGQLPVNVCKGCSTEALSIGQKKEKNKQ